MLSTGNTGQDVLQKINLLSNEIEIVNKKKFRFNIDLGTKIKTAEKDAQNNYELHNKIKNLFIINFCFFNNEV